MKPELLKDKKILVAGLGISGRAALELLSFSGINAKGFDRKKDIKEDPEIKKFTSNSIDIVTENFEKEVINSDLIILSPGIDQRDKIFLEAEKRGAIVTGELEFASWFTDIPLIAITGTNGKSTVTELTASMLEHSGLKVFKGGNLGTPLSKLAISSEEYDLAVIEVSSFQLDTIIDFKPFTAAILNITEDHMDRYDDMKKYSESKFKIFKNQTENNHSILNSSLQSLSKVLKSQVSFFNSKIKGSDSAHIKDGNLILSIDDKESAIDIKDFKLEGEHNLENLQASALLSIKSGGNIHGIKKAVENFKGLPHRLEFSGIVKTRKFFDDSKGTNPDSVLKALSGFEGNISLIMGGRDKGYSYSPLSETINKKVKNLILIGEAKEKIKKEINFQGSAFFADTMEEAVKTAYENSDENSVIILSPACSSFDMFENYKKRGEAFKECVKKLERLEAR